MKTARFSDTVSGIIGRFAFPALPGLVRLHATHEA